MSDRKPVLCLDFDGVIHAYTSGWKGANVIPDGPVPGAMAFILEAQKHFTVAIYSSRSGQRYGIDAMKFRVALWMKQYLLCAGRGADDEFLSDETRDIWYAALDALQWPTEKPPAHITIDDRAVTFEGDWSVLDPVKLLAFKPWNKR